MLEIAEHSHAILVANWLYFTRNVSVSRLLAILMLHILCYFYIIDHIRSLIIE